MDRQDIDALLVGALYGELTPADEARLTAHLESHPADRGALDDLKSARAKVLESRIFALQVEPPQHISALLLQEAHRRAPKKVVADDGERKDSWFWRFARSFALHPAMAAAAMLVVVLGVSAVVYKNKGADFAQREVSAPAATQSNESANNTAPTTIPPALAGDQGAAAGSAAPSEAYHAGLAEEQDLQNDPSLAEGTVGNANNESASQRWRDSNSKDTDGKVAAPAKNKGIVVTTEQPQPKDLDRDGVADERRNDAERRAVETKLAKEQQEAQQQKTARKADSAALEFGGDSADDGYAPSTGAAPGRGGASGGGGAANGLTVGGAAPSATTAPKGNVAGPTATPSTPAPNRVYAQPPPPPPAPATDKATSTVTTSKPEPAKQPAQTTPKPVAKQEAKVDTKTAGAVAPTAPSGGTGVKTGAGTTTGAKTGSSTTTSDTKKVATQKPADKPAQEKTAEKVEKAPPKAAMKSPAPPQTTTPPPDPTVAWAKQQHASAVKLAKQGDCSGAARVALTVSQKAPAYYASFMASDRELKSCKSYIDSERDKEAEKSAKSRAQKRVNADEAAPANESAK
jgi:hypothetical protein